MDWNIIYNDFDQFIIQGADACIRTSMPKRMLYTSYGDIISHNFDILLNIKYNPDYKGPSYLVYNPYDNYFIKNFEELTTADSVRLKNKWRGILIDLGDLKDICKGDMTIEELLYFIKYSEEELVIR
jgi:hypothetical protein